MRLTHAYSPPCTLGMFFPDTQLVPWAIQHGLDLPVLMEEVVSSPTAAFRGPGVAVSALALLVFLGADGREDHVPLLGLPVVGTMIVSASRGLPPCLLLRETRLAAGR